MVPTDRGQGEIRYQEKILHCENSAALAEAEKMLLLHPWKCSGPAWMEL